MTDFTPVRRRLVGPALVAWGPGSPPRAAGHRAALSVRLTAHRSALGGHPRPACAP